MSNGRREVHPHQLARQASAAGPPEVRSGGRDSARATSAGEAQTSRRGGQGPGGDRPVTRGSQDDAGGSRLRSETAKLRHPHACRNPRSRGPAYDERVADPTRHWLSVQAAACSTQLEVFDRVPLGARSARSSFSAHSGHTWRRSRCVDRSSEKLSLPSFTSPTQSRSSTSRTMTGAVGCRYLAQRPQ